MLVCFFFAGGKFANGVTPIESNLPYLRQFGLVKREEDLVRDQIHLATQSSIYDGAVVSRVTTPLAIAGGRIAVVLTACLFQFLLSACSHSGYSNRNKLRIVTKNTYEGTNFRELAAAQSANEFALAVTTTFRAIQLTNPAERAAAIAREIAATSPHLVALQEASIVRTGAAPPATEVQSDLLQRLLASLERSGQRYTVVSVLQGLDAEVPSTLGFDVRLTTQDAVLARSDLAPSVFSWSNVQAQHYKAKLSFPSPAGPIPFPRGYISVDATVNGHAFRFVTTHLEVDPQIDAAQAAELAAIEGSAPLPVLIARDFN